MATNRLVLALLSGAWALSLALPGHADDADAGKQVVVGATTGNLLAMQREGKSAGAAQPVSGEVATRSYHRYLDSFKKPMPAFNATVGSGMASGSETAK